MTFSVPSSVSRDRWVWRLEVGLRVALCTETMPRDLRWFRGLFS